MHKNNSVEMAVTVLRQKGWLDTFAKIEYRTSDGINWSVDNAMLYPKLKTPEGELTPTDNYIYFGSGYFSPEGRFTDDAVSRVSSFPSVTEFRNKQLFDLVQRATDLAAEMKLPADFINPLTAMAEQLRTNILPAPARDNEEGILF